MSTILSRRDGRGNNTFGSSKQTTQPVAQTTPSSADQLAQAKGFNTILKCRWCGDTSKEVYIPQLSKGKDGKPYSIVYNYEPCEACRKKWANMVIIIETLKKEPYPDCLPLNPNEDNKLYPTGRHVGITKELAQETIDKNANLGMIFFLDCAEFDKAFSGKFEETAK